MAEEAKRKALVRLCGICYNEDRPNSGCGYRGNSPRPIFVTVEEYSRFK